MLLVEKKGQLLGHQAAIYALEWYEPNRRFLTGGGEGYLVGWDLQQLPDGELIMRVDGAIFAVEYLPDREWAVVGTMQGGIYWVDIAKKQLIHQQLAHPKGVFKLQYHQNRLFSLGADGCLSVWDLDSQKRLETVQLSSKSLRNMRLIPSKNELWVSASDGNLYQLSLDFLQLKNIENQAHSGSIFAVDYDISRDWLWTGGKDARLRGWAGSNSGLTPILEQAAHLFCVNSIALSPDFSLLATASMDKTVRIWDASSAALLKSLDTIKYGGHLRSVNSLLWAENGQILLSAGDDRSVICWDFRP